MSETSNKILPRTQLDGRRLLEPFLLTLA